MASVASLLTWGDTARVCLQAPTQYQRKPSCRAAEQPTAAPPPQQPPQQHTAERTILSLPTALGLYGLTNSELLWELQLDTRCLMGWSDSKIVLAFRGTASITNAWSDLQVLMLSAQLHVHGCWRVGELRVEMGGPGKTAVQP